MTPQDCMRLSTAFYARVALNPVLRPLFPGKTFTCAIHEFAAFLVQFLNTGGDSQRRWWLSLRESHARFKLTPEHRAAWLICMKDACSDTELLDFFHQSSKYIVHQEPGPLKSPDLAQRWTAQTLLDDLVATIRKGTDDEAIALAEHPDLHLFARSVRCGLLALMLRSDGPALHDYAATAIQNDPDIIRERFAGFSLLHTASAAGSLRFVLLLLSLGADPSEQTAGRHTALYCLANECKSPSGASVVRALANAGANVNAADGVKHCTPLHMAARRGHVEIARALLESGANPNAKDTQGVTPLRRALNCRKQAVADLLNAWRGT